MVDFGIVTPGNAVGYEGVTDVIGDGGEGGDSVVMQVIAVVMTQKEPIATPGHIAMDGAPIGQGEGDVVGVAIGSDIGDGHTAVRVELGSNRAHGGFDAMFADSHTAEVCQTSDQPDGAVATHPQIAHVIEKNHAGAGTRVVWGAE